MGGVAVIELEDLEILDIDVCCAEFGTGNESMRDACSKEEMLISFELVFDPIDMCRTKIETRIEYQLPNAKTVVKVE